MKTIFYACLLLALCAGCTTTYNIKLNDSVVITAKGKPMLDQIRNRWVYVDASGQTNEIPAGRVLEISPR